MEEDGLLLSVNMKSKFDYESVYLSEGKLYYTFNAGKGALLISTKTPVNDGKWHKVFVSRDQRDGKKNAISWHTTSKQRRRFDVLTSM